MTSLSAIALDLSDDRRRAPSRPPRRRFGPTVVELGNEPPLDGSDPLGPVRHALSLRWLSASILTALAGSLLLGTAIFVSADGEIVFAEAPEADALGGRAGEDGSGAARKGDKLVRAESVVSAKQAFRAPMTLRVADREVIKVRPFVRLTTALSMTSGTYATSIPPFNPTRFFAESAADRIAEAPPETSDAEMTIVRTDLSLVAIPAGGLALSDADVLAQVRNEARPRTGGAGQPALLGLAATLALPRTPGIAGATDASVGVLAGPADPQFRSIEVRVVPENVSQIEKLPESGGDTGFREATHVFRRGDSLDAVVTGGGATADDARAIAAALGRDRVAALADGMQLRLLSGPSAQPGGRRRLLRVSLVTERGLEAIAAMNDRGAFVTVAVPDAAAPKAQVGRARTDDEDDEDEGTGVTLYDSLYETALKQELSRGTVEDLVRIFGYDVDFQRRVSPGDSFELFYATDEEGSADRLEILSAALTIGSEVHRVFRYQGDDGTVEYFDGAGRSLKKFLLRKPVPEGRMSSPFGSRYHPILGYSKVHTGVDWAAPSGTPIFAAGNGTVIKADWSSGYGRRTEVQHTNGYVTAYNHQSAFGRGIVAGAKVRQGQIIGYVGSTGLSTGAHLHYEVLVNGHFVDPLKIRLPRGRELDGRALAEFGRQRDQIDGLMAKAGGPNKLAQGESR